MELEQELSVRLSNMPPASKDILWTRGQTFEVHLVNVEHTYHKNGDHRFIIKEGGRGHVGIFIRPRLPLIRSLPVLWYLMTVFPTRDLLGCDVLELRERKGIELEADLNANTRWASLAGRRAFHKCFDLLLRIEYPDPDGNLPVMHYQENVSYPIHVSYKPLDDGWRRVDRRHSTRRSAVKIQQHPVEEHTIYHILQDE